MKRKLIGFSLIAVLIILCAVAGFFINERVKERKYLESLPEQVYTGKIIDKQEDCIIVAGDENSMDSSPVCSISLKNAEIKKSDEQREVKKSELKPGMTVEVKYKGGQAETFPAVIDFASCINITSEGDDIVGLYIQAIDRLYNEDTALNSGISKIAFDLSKADNLTNGEKSGLIWMCNNKFGMETIEATFESLREFGYIDEDKNRFTDGILFSIEQTEQTDDGFVFNITKWRSALGAYCFYGCKAVKNEDGLHFEIGDIMAA